MDFSSRRLILQDEVESERVWHLHLSLDGEKHRHGGDEEAAKPPVVEEAPREKFLPPGGVGWDGAAQRCGRLVSIEAPKTSSDDENVVEDALACLIGIESKSFRRSGTTMISADGRTEDIAAAGTSFATIEEIGGPVSIDLLRRYQKYCLALRRSMPKSLEDLRRAEHAAQRGALRRLAALFVRVEKNGENVWRIRDEAFVSGDAEAFAACSRMISLLPSSEKRSEKNATSLLAREKDNDAMSRIRAQLAEIVAEPKPVSSEILFEARERRRRLFEDEDAGSRRRREIVLKEAEERLDEEQRRAEDLGRTRLAIEHARKAELEREAEAMIRDEYEARTREAERRLQTAKWRISRLERLPAARAQLLFLAEQDKVEPLETGADETVVVPTPPPKQMEQRESVLEEGDVRLEEVFDDEGEVETSEKSSSNEELSPPAPKQEEEEEEEVYGVDQSEETRSFSERIEAISHEEVSDTIGPYSVAMREGLIGDFLARDVESFVGGVDGISCSEETKVEERAEEHDEEELGLFLRSLKDGAPFTKEKLSSDLGVALLDLFEENRRCSRLVEDEVASHFLESNRLRRPRSREEAKKALFRYELLFAQRSLSEYYFQSVVTLSARTKKRRGLDKFVQKLGYRCFLEDDHLRRLAEKIRREVKERFCANEDDFDLERCRDDFANTVAEFARGLQRRNSAPGCRRDPMCLELSARLAYFAPLS